MHKWYNYTCLRKNRTTPWKIRVFRFLFSQRFIVWNCNAHNYRNKFKKNSVKICPKSVKKQHVYSKKMSTWKYHYINLPQKQHSAQCMRILFIVCFCQKWFCAKTKLIIMMFCTWRYNKPLYYLFKHINHLYYIWTDLSQKQNESEAKNPILILRSML